MNRDFWFQHYSANSYYIIVLFIVVVIIITLTGTYMKDQGEERIKPGGVGHGLKIM